MDSLFWSKVAMAACWEWTGAKDRSGYGCVRRTGRTLVAHRYAYEQLVGQVPLGLQLDHLCRNRACVNPDHLEPVTPLVNTRRSRGNATKTHCPAGHEYTPENTYRWKNAPSESRQCRTCITARNRQKRMAI